MSASERTIHGTKALVAALAGFFQGAMGFYSIGQAGVARPKPECPDVAALPPGPTGDPWRGGGPTRCC